MRETLREPIEKMVPLTEEEFAFVLAHFTLKQYKKREFLIGKGQRVKYAYDVVSGILMLVYPDEWGKQVLNQITGFVYRIHSSKYRCFLEWIWRLDCNWSYFLTPIKRGRAW